MAPAESFLAKQQLLKTSSPDIANGGGMETETDVQSGQVARGFPTDQNELGAFPLGPLGSSSSQLRPTLELILQEGSASFLSPDS